MYHFEEVFRSQNKLIVDTVCKEFVFVLELFDLKMSQVTQIFNQIFSKVVNRYLTWLTAYNPIATQASNRNTDIFLSGIAQVHEAASITAAHNGGMDIFALLLCIQLNEEFRRLMQITIKIPILDLYHDRISMCLWPKLTSLFQHYIDTLQSAVPRNFKQNNQPVLHSVTQKYVVFTAGVYHLCHNITSNS